MLHVVIMAGGAGTRFWPRSRTTTPKQLLNIVGETTMIQQTAARVESLVKPEQTWVVTNALQAPEVFRQLPLVPRENILIEPVGRNTAPCIGLAALHILKKDPQAVMAVLAADHLIKPDSAFCDTLSSAAKIAHESHACITIGIIPTRPETGYGYIQFVENEFKESGNHRAHRVKTFAEKPNLETAINFVAAGDFLWNSGMFIWRADTIVKLIEIYLPELHEGLMEIEQTLGTTKYDKTLDRVYHKVKGISIDYGVMEHTKDVYVIPSSFEWNDVGSWEEVYHLSPKDATGNAVMGEAILLDSTNTLVYAPGKIVAGIGLNDYIIVSTNDALLIVPRAQAQDVKKIVEELQRRKKNEFL